MFTPSSGKGRLVNRAAEEVTADVSERMSTLHMTVRWFGPADPVPLWKLRQVPNLSGIVSAQCALAD